MEQIAERYLPILLSVSKFIIGDFHKTMAFVYLMMVINWISLLVKPAGSHKIHNMLGEKLFAYTSFIVLGNVLDQLLLDHMTGVEGVTQTLVCLYLVVREGILFKEHLYKAYGIEIPIIDQQLESLKQKANGGRAESDLKIEDEIEKLKKHLDELEKKKKGGDVV